MNRKEIEESLRQEQGMLQHWTYLLENRDHKTRRLTRIIREAQEELEEVETQRLKAPQFVETYSKSVAKLEYLLKRSKALEDPRARKIRKLKAELAKLEKEGSC